MPIGMHSHLAAPSSKISNQFLKTLFALTGCCFSSGSSTTTETKAIEEYTVEYKLATLYSGSPIEEDDVTVYQFKNLLNSLEKKTINSRINIADITVTTQRLLKEKGISRTLLQILNDFDTSIPDGSSGFKLEEIASAYMVLMTE